MNDGLAAEAVVFARANLPEAPARVLEIGAGDGALARALAGAGYSVVAIDPNPRGADVRATSLHELDEPAASFDAALAVWSLHHVRPLDESIRRLADLLAPGALLLVDEFDVDRLDRRAAAWWLEQRRARGADAETTPERIVEEHRAHLHSLERIVQALEPHFDVGRPLRGAWLYRWDLDDSLRADEEELIAAGLLPAVGARLVARRPSPPG